MDERTLARFESKYIMCPISGCWLWTSDTNNKGYGSFHVDKAAFGKSNLLAHRFSFLIYVGPIPDGLCVLHRCDTPCCVNPSHLFLGTMQDNTRDMITKGRHRYRTRTGPNPHPERYPRGDQHYSRLRPESLARGDNNGARKHPEKVQRGEARPQSKLTEVDVVQILVRYAAGGTSYRLLALEYGVDKAVITRIIHGKAWAHVSRIAV